MVYILLAIQGMIIESTCHIYNTQVNDYKYFNQTNYLKQVRLSFFPNWSTMTSNDWSFLVYNWWQLSSIIWCSISNERTFLPYVQSFLRTTNAVWILVWCMSNTRVRLKWCESQDDWEWEDCPRYVNVYETILFHYAICLINWAYFNLMFQLRDYVMSVDHHVWMACVCIYIF